MAGAPGGYPPPQPGFYQPQYPPQYQQPFQQQPAPPPPAQAAMQQQPGEDLAEYLIRQHKQLEKAAKAISKRADRHGPDDAEQQTVQPARGPRAHEDWLQGLQYLSDEQLEAELAKHPIGSRHHRNVIDEMEARQGADEFGADDDEIPAMEVRNVAVDDGSTGWINVSPSMAVENLQDLADQVRSAHPYARRMKFGQVTRDGRTIKNGRGGTSIVSIRSDEEVRANLAKDIREGRADPQRLASMPPPPAPAGLTSEGQIMFKALAESQSSLVASIIAKPREDESKKLLDTIALVKTIMVDPMIEMMKAQQRGGGDNDNGLKLAQAVITGATALSKSNNSGGTGGTLDSIMNVIERAGPMLMRPQAQPALPAPQTEKLPDQDPGVIMQRKIREKIGRAMQYLLGGKLQARQLPRFAYQNLDDASIGAILTAGAEGFAGLVRAVAIEQQLPQTYMQREDVKRGFVWVYEEIQRMALVLNWHESAGRMQERQRLLAWTTPEVVPWREGNPIIGDEAAQMFAQAYPAIFAASQEDELPPQEPASMHAPVGARSVSERSPQATGPLHVVRDDLPDEEPDNPHAPNIIDGPEPTIVDPFGGAVQHRPQQRVAGQGRPRPSDPGF